MTRLSTRLNVGFRKILSESLVPAFKSILSLNFPCLKVCGCLHVCERSDLYTVFHHLQLLCSASHIYSWEVDAKVFSGATVSLWKIRCRMKIARARE